MKRPALVIASSVVLILLSLLQILTSLLMVLTGVNVHPGQLPARPGVPLTPVWMPLFAYGLAALCAGLAVWGIATAIGVYRLRRWARISILIIGGCMAALGLVALAGTVLSIAVFSSFAPAGAAGAPGSAAILKVVFAVIALFYATVAAIGIFWLVYFNRQTARTAFVGGADAALEPPPASRRPLLISIYAVFSLVGAPFCLLLVFIPFPALLFGELFITWKKALIYLAYAAIQAAIGVGLWKLAEWGRRLALAFLALGAAMILAYLVWPPLVLRSNELIYHSMGVHSMGMAQPALPQHFMMAIYTTIFGFSLLFMAAAAWMLHYYRNRFVPPAPAATTAEV